MSKMKIIGDEEVKQSFYGQLVRGKGVSSDLGELLAKEANKAGNFPCANWSNATFTDMLLVMLIYYILL